MQRPYNIAWLLQESLMRCFCYAHTQCIPHSLCWFFSVAPASFVLLGLAASHTSTRLSFCWDRNEWLWILNAGLESLRERKEVGSFTGSSVLICNFRTQAQTYSCYRLVLQPRNANLLSKTKKYLSDKLWVKAWTDKFADIWRKSLILHCPWRKFTVLRLVSILANMRPECLVLRLSLCILNPL